MQVEVVVGVDGGWLGWTEHQRRDCFTHDASIVEIVSKESDGRSIAARLQL